VAMGWFIVAAYDAYSGANFTLLFHGANRERRQRLGCASLFSLISFSELGCSEWNENLR
jgi:hypothetical protein